MEQESAATDTGNADLLDSDDEKQQYEYVFDQLKCCKMVKQPNGIIQSFVIKYTAVVKCWFILNVQYLVII
ncbi:hypothetical protein H920_12066 [Fukomys damarensis]|uniref:Uncharacterized protein n=1 Tax=Fukomys damarensis TaxID=885580 RepID=A0A091D634_FUKDA|nr:hypothetical protein H920_12066 [Fukomys damarensis]